MGTDKRERQKAGRQARIEAARVAQEKADRRARVIRLVATVAGILALVAAVAYFTRRTDTTAAPSDSTQPATTVAEGGPASVPPAPAGKSITGETPCPAADGSPERTTKFEKAPPMCIDKAKTYTATFDTNKGAVTVKLDAAKMPSTVNNFVVLSRYKYYDGTSMFRVDPSIAIIQGGAASTNSASDPGPGYTIPDEGGKFTYKEGQLVMARTQQPNSSGSQYFLTTGPEVSALDAQGTYLLFGDVTEGLPVLKEIQASGVPFPEGSPMAGLGSGPKDPVIVNKVTITES